MFESYAPDFEALSLVATSFAGWVELLEEHELVSPDSLLFRTWVKDR